ncbi:serine peptidase [Amycolatopsis coloradensis]|uniref:Serine peptidase n=1 Tax=Amycolatopsis coloradensis TaxID=76021 RepID=A0ACD5BDM0_9PSEU
MLQIIGVHGVGNHRPGETVEHAALQLSTVWRRHLSTGFPAIQSIDVAYYADQLRAPGRQGGDDLDNLPPEAEQMLRAWLESLDLPIQGRQGWGTWPLRQVLSWVAERRGLSPRLVNMFVATFFREVAAYLNPDDDSARTAARERVVHTLRSRHAKVVIAHSLGSVVAYEALWECQDVPVDLLITLGSPLALPHAVFPRLCPPPADGRGARPPGVARWVNLADPGDLVAVPPFGVSRRFADVDVDEHSVAHAFDFHLVSNYLSCARVASVLTEYSRRNG